MAEMEFFPQRPDAHPMIYAYEFVGVDSHKGYIKVGYTERDVDTRIKEQLHTAAVPYRLLAYWSAMKNDGSCFTDHDVHAVLKKKGCRQLNEGEDRNEWFKCNINDVKAAVTAVQKGVIKKTSEHYSPLVFLFTGIPHNSLFEANRLLSSVPMILYPKQKLFWTVEEENPHDFSDSLSKNILTKPEQWRKIGKVSW